MIVNEVIHQNCRREFKIVYRIKLSLFPTDTFAYYLFNLWKFKEMRVYFEFLSNDQERGLREDAFNLKFNQVEGMCDIAS